MLTLSLDIPSVARRAEREDDTVNDPLAILIAAEEELEFDDFDLGVCLECGVQFKSNDWVWDGKCIDCM